MLEARLVLKKPTLEQLSRMRDKAIREYQLAKDNKNRADNRLQLATETVNALSFFIKETEGKTK